MSSRRRPAWTTTIPSWPWGCLARGLSVDFQRPLILVLGAQAHRRQDQGLNVVIKIVLMVMGPKLISLQQQSKTAHMIFFCLTKWELKWVFFNLWVYNVFDEIIWNYMKTEVWWSTCFFLFFVKLYEIWSGVSLVFMVLIFFGYNYKKTEMGFLWFLSLQCVWWKFCVNISGHKWWGGRQWEWQGRTWWRRASTWKWQ